jgi:hypothetical protein
LEYTSEKYINLLKTFPDHLNMEEGFFSEIKDIIKSNENKIDVRITINLEIAEKKL